MDSGTVQIFIGVVGLILMALGVNYKMKNKGKQVGKDNAMQQQNVGGDANQAGGNLDVKK